MANFYEVKASKEGKDGKTFWTRIGTMWPMKNGGGYRIVFDALPVPTIYEGKIKTECVAWEPKDTAGSGGGGSTRNDDIPY